MIQIRIVASSIPDGSVEAGASGEIECVCWNRNSIRIRISRGNCVFKDQCRGATPTFIREESLRLIDYYIELGYSNHRHVFAERHRNFNGITQFIGLIMGGWCW